tara:strand:+ start:425 stop:982 length:558 start_codon:yes stop_codon:yes gene_type:complete
MGSKRAINLLRKQLKNPIVATSMVKDFTYITSASGNHDLSAMPRGDHLIMINAAKADGTYIRLPEATTENGGMHIRVVIGLAVADDFAVGFVTSKISGGAVAVGDTNEAQGSSLDYATAIANNGDDFLSVRFNLDTAGAAGGTEGTVLDFFYPGVANVVLYRGHLISEIDNPTLADHFSTTAVTS